MKKFLTIVGLSLLVLSCGSSKDESTKYNRAEETPLKGNWVVDNVEYSQDKIKVKAFGIADAQCFKGSVWSLVPNNHTGSMEEGIGNSDCPNVSTDFTWYVDPNDTFYLKPVGEGDKAKDVKDGYIFKLNRTSDTSFSLVQTANLDGTPVYISYNFLKQ